MLSSWDDIINSSLFSKKSHDWEKTSFLLHSVLTQWIWLFWRVFSFLKRFPPTANNIDPLEYWNLILFSIGCWLFYHHQVYFDEGWFVYRLMLNLSWNWSFCDKLDFIGKVNSVQEACLKCFAVHILEFEILQTT